MAEKNIFQRMLAISAEISNVAKNLNVGVGGSSYKAVGEADVLAAVKPIEARHGVYSYPSSRKVISEDVLTTTRTFSGKTTESRQLFMRIETIYRFVNVDEPKDYIEVTTYGDGVDSQDKACGKAMTYADKYALLKAYKIMTGDDPDQHASETLQSTRRYDGYEPFNPRDIWGKLMVHFGYKKDLSEEDKAMVKASALDYLKVNFNIDSGAQIQESMVEKINADMEKK